MTPLIDFFTNPLLVVAWVLALVAGIGRLTRLVTYDDFPPTAWLRNWWTGVTSDEDGNDGPWRKILTCMWCFPPYAVAASIGFFVIGLLWVPWMVVVWWVLHVWAGLAYVVSILVAYDEREG